MLFSVFSITASGATEVVKSKLIKYRNGITVFSIPENWKEEYDPKGGAMFYEDLPDSGTLRLNVLSFDSPDISAKEMAMQVFPKNGFKVIQNRFPLEYKVKEVIENQERLKIHTWSVAVPIEPRSVRIIVFSHTVLSDLDKNESIMKEISFLHGSIEAASYSLEQGVAGEFYQ